VIGDDDLVLVTTHRAENVDNPRNLKEFLRALSPPDLIMHFPRITHPHTNKRIEEFGVAARIGMISISLTQQIT